jgi:hypothetical protein
MKPYIAIALGIVAACTGRAAPTAPEDAVKKYFALADEIQAIVGKAASGVETRRAIVDLVTQCCSGELQSHLSGWISAMDLRGSGFSDDIQSMRPIDGPNCGDPKFIGQNRVAVICQYATAESYSLARNLLDVRDLYAQYPISNVSVHDLTLQAARQAVPELIEYEVFAERSVELGVQLVEGRWRVSSAVVKVRDATVDIRLVN